MMFVNLKSSLYKVNTTIITYHNTATVCLIAKMSKNAMKIIFSS